MRTPTYILITAARNEEAFIDKTIQSVIHQTLLPKAWVIVSDGSTDGTDEIIQGRARGQGWIHFLRQPEHEDRQFAAKARCFAAGRAALASVPYDVIGNLDADLSFGPGVMEFLMSRFALDPRLGVAGVPFVDPSMIYDYRHANIEHVSGACQLFRRECFEAIGGYKPIMGGGIDWLAVTTARMMGWKTRTFVEHNVIHHRAMGTGKGKKLGALYHHGRKDYYLGNHPLWEVLRTFYQFKHKPFVMGGLMIFLGYVSALVRRIERPVPPEVVEFCRREQIRRLRAAFRLRKAGGTDEGRP